MWVFLSIVAGFAPSHKEANKGIGLFPTPIPNPSTVLPRIGSGTRRTDAYWGKEGGRSGTADILTRNVGAGADTGGSQADETRFYSTKRAASIASSSIIVVTFFSWIDKAITTGGETTDGERRRTAAMAEISPRATKSRFDAANAVTPVPILDISIIALFSIASLEMAVPTGKAANAERAGAGPPREDHASHGATIVVVPIAVIALLRSFPETVAAISGQGSVPFGEVLGNDEREGRGKEE